MTGVKMTCPRCEYAWEYKGRRPFATCPWCHTTVRVPGRPLTRGAKA